MSTNNNDLIVLNYAVEGKLFTLPGVPIMFHMFTCMIASKFIFHLN